MDVAACSTASLHISQFERTVQEDVSRSICGSQFFRTSWSYQSRIGRPILTEDPKGLTGFRIQARHRIPNRGRRELGEPVRTEGDRLEADHPKLWRLQDLGHDRDFELLRLGNLTKKFDQEQSQVSPQILRIPDAPEFALVGADFGFAEIVER